MLQVTLHVMAFLSSICTDIIDSVAPSLYQINRETLQWLWNQHNIKSLLSCYPWCVGNVKTPLFNDENTNILFFFLLQYKGKTFSEWPIDFRELCSSTQQNIVLLLCFPKSFYQKLYRYNFSKQISLSYKNRLFFFHKIIHIINFRWYNHLLR